MTLAAGWYPVALSEGLERATSTGTHLFGEELVVWRDRDGTAHVWQDRCPHRGMRLSFGFVRGDQIACLYHGWRYDAAGQCRSIPAHPQLIPPESIKVVVYECAERVGMVWVRKGQPAGTSALPDERATTPVRSLHVECPAETLIAHLSAATLPPFDAAAGNSACSVTVTPGMVTLFNDRDQLLVGVQPIGPAATALHIAVAGSSAYRGAGQKHFNAWAEDLRRVAEEAPATDMAEAAR